MNIQKQAFSLIELSIFVVIAAILTVGFLSISVSGVNNSKVKITNDRIKTIYNALGTFLIINERLPCPGSTTYTKTANSTYGDSEGTAGTCATSGRTYSSTTSTDLVYGMVPFKVLGLPNEMGEDGFETKLAYIVDKRFTLASSFSTTSPSSILTIQEKSNGSTTTITSDAIFAIISYGANKSGGYPANLTVQTTRSTDADEMENDITTQVGSTAVFTNTLIASSGSSDTFDDTVFYKTRNNFVQDFSAFKAIDCASATYVDLYGTTDVTWPIGAYDQEVLATTACPAGYTSGPTYPTRKCGEFGNWGAVKKPCVAP